MRPGRIMRRPGPTNSILDVTGLRVGHHDLREPGWLTGSTVVLTPPEGAVAGVDVRGGGPGTRETDLLDPRNLVERVHAIVLTGGSAFGLAAADGVVRELFAAGVGYPMGGPGQVVPIVPASAMYDLGRGGVFEHVPDARTGAAAYHAAGRPDAHPGSLRLGIAGAGTGAVSGGLKGGVGSASVLLDDGTSVAALTVVNSFGSCVHERTGRLHAEPFCLPGDLPPMRAPEPAEVDAAREAAAARWAGQPLRYALATTLAVVGTDATLTKAQCAKVSGVAHDGMARAIRPLHAMVDGDTVFTLATCQRGAPDPAAFHALLESAADCLTRSIARAIVAAESVVTPAGAWRSYQEAFGSAFLV
ncbi:MAG TPA: P1 family peptidase [Dermatophilaceae bacterium]|nr:P1 family peptidase [Dermatophilaceae bacterium]